MRAACGYRAAPKTLPRNILPRRNNTHFLQKRRKFREYRDDRDLLEFRLPLYIRPRGRYLWECL